MLKSKYKWNLIHSNEINNENELINVLLKNRNITDSDRFFNKDDFFYDPFLFNEMKCAVTRVYEAIQNKEKIMLYGDYDVDGVTGTAILYKTLKKLQADVDFYIPNRFTEGYGPNLNAFRQFVENGINLIITIDNGITGIEEALFLHKHRVDLIITDHHEGKETIPKAHAIIHPKLKNEQYPFKDLSGCGVALKFSHALLEALPIDYLDLASLGTYADIVSVSDENRSIIKLGLNQLAQTKHIGLQIITELTKVKVFDEYALGFIYGPRLNAPGRMLSACDAVKLLVTEDVNEAVRIANEIELLNKERKLTIDAIIEEAIDIIETNEYHRDHVIVVAKEDWHEGVLGIAANKLVDLYHKPVIVLTENDNLYKGSCRTLSDFPLFENLSKCGDLLVKYGGHKMAAGIQLCKEHIDKLRERLHDLAGSELCHSINIDCMPHPKVIHTKVTKEIERFKPFGPNNQNPIFLLKEYEIQSITQMGTKNKHLRLILKKENSVIQGVAFNKGHYYHILSEQDVINVVGTFEINEYNNKTTNQLIIKDLECNHLQIFDYRSKPFIVDTFKEHDLQYLYFENDYGYHNALQFNKDEVYKNIVLIDIPNNSEALIELFNKNKLEKVYLLCRCRDIFSSEHLLTREKMGKLYQMIKKLNHFKLKEERVQYELATMGFDKKIQNIAIQVFFELNFVIIENEEIFVIDNPIKRNLSESKTYQKINENIQLKEKLLLSSTQELKEFIVNLSNGG